MVARCRNRSFSHCRIVVAVAAWCLWLSAAPVVACPFCEGVRSTLALESQEYHAIVIGKLQALPRGSLPDETPLGRFVITHVLKGGEEFSLPTASEAAGEAPPQAIIEAPLYGEAALGTPFLLRAVADEQQRLTWNIPIQLGPRGPQYLLGASKLPSSGPGRLRYFLPYLLDNDTVIASDAYAEFALAPYRDLMAMRDALNPDELLKRALDLKSSDRRRRLYLTMLGVCGRPEHARALEPLLIGYPPHPRGDLDAMAACYLALEGESGLPLLENWFLANPCADPSEVYAITAALRFHGDDAKVIERARLAKALAHLLSTLENAERVLPDLARWEDWSVVDRVIELVRETAGESTFAREMAVQYLLTCPLPRAAAEITRLEESEPAIVHRASRTLGGVSTLGSAPVPPPPSDDALPTPDGSRKVAANASSTATAGTGTNSPRRDSWRTPFVLGCLTLGATILYLGLHRAKSQATPRKRNNPAE